TYAPDITITEIPRHVKEFNTPDYDKSISLPEIEFNIPRAEIPLPELPLPNIELPELPTQTYLEPVNEIPVPKIVREISPRAYEPALPNISIDIAELDIPLPQTKVDIVLPKLHMTNVSLPKTKLPAYIKPLTSSAMPQINKVIIPQSHELKLIDIPVDLNETQIPIINLKKYKNINNIKITNFSIYIKNLKFNNHQEFPIIEYNHLKINKDPLHTISNLMFVPFAEKTIIKNIKIHKPFLNIINFYTNRFKNITYSTKIKNQLPRIYESQHSINIFNILHYKYNKQIFLPTKFGKNIIASKKDVPGPIYTNSTPSIFLSSQNNSSAIKQEMPLHVSENELLDISNIRQKNRNIPLSKNIDKLKAATFKNKNRDIIYNTQISDTKNYSEKNKQNTYIDLIIQVDRKQILHNYIPKKINTYLLPQRETNTQANFNLNLIDILTAEKHPFVF
ncbi:MAG: hypothetical protein PHZ27_06150, partial [Candidatus Omnitrophica bacterium]|nr:hypothetical protein [Candidatus Omnitrophota bacterium]